MFYFLLALFGCLSGITTVLFGFGGGFVVVPLLYGMLLAIHTTHDSVGQSAMHIAIATSTCVMIVNALIATRNQSRTGNIKWSYIWPLAGFIGMGAIIGACAATLVSGGIVRFAFVAYLGLTILDSVMRRGFLSHTQVAKAQRLSHTTVIAGGIVIGSIATFLGVGGSVMTVPLLRRSGLTMMQATAMANPLALPVAIVGTLTFMTMSWYHPISLGPWFVGYLDIQAFATLALGSMLGIRLATPIIGRIPDRIHARVYVGLLVIVMISMLV